MAVVPQQRPAYNLETAPWCFQKPSAEQICSFNNSFSKQVMSEIFGKLKDNPNLSHHAVILPELGGITAGEMALMYLRANMASSRKRKQIRKQKKELCQQLDDEQVEEIPCRKKKKQFSVWANCQNSDL